MAKRKRDDNLCVHRSTKIENPRKKHELPLQNKSPWDRPSVKPQRTKKPPKYQYAPLPDERGSIRLLELLPGNLEGNLHCNIYTKRLQDSPSYEAISYTWGSEKDSSEVLCHGQSISVPRNLIAALRKLRFQDRSRLLWADSISIDQANIRERGHQIIQMGTIFQKAERVIAWLGDNTDYSSITGLQHIREVASRLEETAVCDVVINASKELDRFDLFHKDIQRQGEANDDAPSPIWGIFHRILNSPWFSRVWILQEIGLAAKALLVLGNFEMEWNAFTKLCQSLLVGECTSTHHAVQSLQLKRVNTMSLFNFKAGSNTHAGTILHMARRFNSSNAHDQVYAVLGHAAFNRLSQESGTESWIPVDYSLHHSETYLAVAKELLKGLVPLSCLHLVYHTSTTIYKAPYSWVPQWNMEAPRLLCQDFETHRCREDTTPKFFVEAQTLYIHGFSLDTVEYCSKIMKDEDLVWAFGAKMGEQLVSLSIKEAWRRLKLKRQGSPEEMDILKDMCNALTAGGVMRYEDGETIRIPDKPTASGMTAGYKSRDILDIDIAGCPAEILAYFKAIGINPPRVFLGTRDTFSRTKQAIQLSFDRRLFITRNGYFGIGPRVMRPGDSVCFFLGDPVPFILRAKSRGEESRLVGECYIAGIRLEEILQMGKRGDLEERIFTIV